MKKLLTLLLLLTIFSCSKKNSTSPYEGIWLGTFTGTDDFGTFHVEVDSKGKVTGNVISDANMLAHTVDGVVDASGNLNMTIVNAWFTGSFLGTMQNTTVSGTWVNTIPDPDQSGTWMGNKQ